MTEIFASAARIEKSPWEPIAPAIRGSEPANGDAGPRTAQLDIDPSLPAHDLAGLVLTLVELLRQLMERQAIRRLDQGDLDPEREERLGTRPGLGVGPAGRSEVAGSFRERMTVMKDTAKESAADDALAHEMRKRCSEDTPLRIGSRTSPMATAQAEHVRALIEKRVPGLSVQIVGMETSADLWQGSLTELGGKGNFTKEIDSALVSGRIDLAVHCLKDVPGDTPLPEGTEFVAHLERTDVHDVAVFRAGSPFTTLAELPAGSIVGTSSVRRRAALSKYRPDLRVEPIRGNVNSRLAKLDTGDDLAALIVARPGLARIGMTDRRHQVLPISYAPGQSLAMVPAVGAGVISLQARSADSTLVRLLAEFDHEQTSTCVTGEREMLRGLRGHCNSPIAGYAALLPDGQIHLHGMVFNGDGSEFVYSDARHAEPGLLGELVAAELLRQGADGLIAATRK